MRSLYIAVSHEVVKRHGIPTHVRGRADNEDASSGNWGEFWCPLPFVRYHHSIEPQNVASSVHKRPAEAAASDTGIDSTHRPGLVRNAREFNLGKSSLVNIIGEWRVYMQVCQ